MLDAEIQVEYFASIYWATVTCTTVGYGDIIPSNNYELMYAVLIMVIGVSIFSFFLSDLSSKFGELLQED